MHRNNRAKASGWRNDILAWAGYWEPIAFIRRGGRSYRDIEKDEYPYSEDLARRLHRLGINLVFWHYYKGLGLKTEAEEMKRTAGFFRHCERHGLRKGVYINFGSYFADTLPAEHPPAEQWPSRDQFGQPHQYSEYYRCYYRFRPCMSHLDFAEYVGKAAVKAIKEAGADMIVFDNNAQMPCYCDDCRKNFPKYLTKKYPSRPTGDRISFKERFGYDFTGRFELPRGTARMPIDSLPGAHEPGLYEWVRYRQHLYEAAHRRVTEMIRAARPDVLITWNAAPLDYGEFPGLVWGFDPETAYRCGSDILCSEDENHAGLEEGRLVSHIRTYKYARAMKNRAYVHGLPPGSSGEKACLNYAESIIFNQGYIGQFMPAMEEDDKFTPLTKSLAFFRQNRRVYLGAEPVSEAVLYRCSESETAAWADTTLSRLAVEQVLIKNSIQYDCVINDRLEEIFRYPLLICANTSYVSDRAAAVIVRYVQQGGKLLCTEDSFRFDEYGRKRIFAADMGLVGERDASLGRVSGRHDPSAILRGLGLERAPAARVYYLPKLEYARTFSWDPASSRHPVIGKEYFIEPGNRGELLTLLDQALGRRLITLTAPENVVAALFRAADGKRFIHLLDYQAGRKLTGVRVSCADEGPVRAGVFRTIAATTSLPLRRRNGRIEATLPPFRTYSFLEI